MLPRIYPHGPKYTRQMNCIFGSDTTYPSINSSATIINPASNKAKACICAIDSYLQVDNASLLESFRVFKQCNHLLETRSVSVYSLRSQGELITSNGSCCLSIHTAVERSDCLEPFCQIDKATFLFLLFLFIVSPMHRSTQPSRNCTAIRSSAVVL